MADLAISRWDLKKSVLSKFIQQSWKKLFFTGVPHPQNLTMNRQLRNSIFISWDVPENIGSFDIQAYHIYVNGQLRSSVKASERTKALLEDINFDEVCIVWSLMYICVCYSK